MRSLPMCWFNILLYMYSNVHVMVVYFANNPFLHVWLMNHVLHILCINLPLRLFSVDNIAESDILSQSHCMMFSDVY